VSPTQIERVLLRNPEIAECAVVDYPDQTHGAVACAAIVLIGGFTGTGDDLANAANATLPYYEQLRYLALMDNIPRSATGKIDRRQVRALVHDTITPTPIAPQD
jgi:long-chain acyl-CoA synthetase